MFGKFSRRHFAKFAGLSALGMARRRPTPPRNRRPSGPGLRVFRKTSCGAPPRRPIRSRAPSTRTAGAARSGTRLPTRPARSRMAATGDRANEHYHRYKEDIGLIQRTGRQGLSVLDRVAAGVSGRNGQAEPQGPRLLRPPHRRTAQAGHRAAIQRSITGICRRRSRTRSAAGDPAKPQKHSAIMPATWRRASPIASSRSSRSTKPEGS